MTRHPALRRLLTLGLVAAAFYFLGRTIWLNAGQLRSFRWEVRPGLLVLSVALLSGVLLWGVVVWRLLLRRCGVEVPFRALARAWFLSNLSRYIPGVVWQFVSLAQLGPSVGLTPAVTVTSLLVQMGFLLLSAGAVGVYLLPADMAGPLAGLVPPLRWVAAPAAVLLVHPRVIRAGLGVFARVTRRAVLEWRGSWVDGLGMLALSAASWAAYGAAFWLFLLAFVPLPLSALPAVTAVNALAFIVGYAVFVVPGGVGFKEWAMALLLSGLVPAGVAGALAVASRLWSIAAELGPALLLARRGRVVLPPDDG